MTILVATDFSTRSLRAVRRAGLIARETGAALALVHVVDDDRPAPLVEAEAREAARDLGEQAETLAELRGLGARPVVAKGDVFGGILRTATAEAARLVVMGAHRKQILRDIFVGTTLERVIRTGPYPVLMVNTEAGHAYRRAIAAVDMSEPSANAIAAAKGLGLVADAGLTLVHAYQAFPQGKLATAGLRNEEIEDIAARERLRVEAELVEFAARNRLALNRSQLRLEEGGPVQSVAAAVKALEPDLLVVGTHGRSGIVKLLLGSVSEEILRSLEVDILAVPPRR